MGKDKFRENDMIFQIFIKQEEIKNRFILCFEIIVFLYFVQGDILFFSWQVNFKGFFVKNN